jgi:ribonuclease HI/GNAT superfamily N-acetyltransferase
LAKKSSKTPLPTIIIREAVPDDCDAISMMIHELADYERAPEKCFATPDKVRERLFGKTRSAEALIVEVEGKPAAHAIFFHNFSTWECAPGLYLEDVYVRPAYRRLGIGNRLLRNLAALAVKRGCKRFEWVVLDWNKLARDFYESIGAVAQTDWIIYRMEGERLAAFAAEAKPLDEAKPTATQMKPSGTFVIYTDGGSDPNPGLGAWAAAIRSGNDYREISGSEQETTNNRMELTAAIKALELVPEGAAVEMHTDSQYLKNGITSWIAGWKRKGWRTTTGPVKNQDLWERLDAVNAARNVKWTWVRGHDGDEMNERVDALCTEARKKAAAR